MDKSNLDQMKMQAMSQLYLQKLAKEETALMWGNYNHHKLNIVKPTLKLRLPEHNSVTKNKINSSISDYIELMRLWNESGKSRAISIQTGIGGAIAFQELLKQDYGRFKVKAIEP